MIRLMKKVTGLASDLGNVTPHLVRGSDQAAAAIAPRMKFLSWNAKLQEWQL